MTDHSSQQYSVVSIHVNVFTCSRHGITIKPITGMYMRYKQLERSIDNKTKALGATSSNVRRPRQWQINGGSYAHCGLICSAKQIGCWNENDWGTPVRKSCSRSWTWRRRTADQGDKHYLNQLFTVQIGCSRVSARRHTYHSDSVVYTYSRDWLHSDRQMRLRSSFMMGIKVQSVSCLAGQLAKWCPTDESSTGLHDEEQSQTFSVHSGATDALIHKHLIIVIADPMRKGWDV